MTVSTIRILIIIVLIAHGAGHYMGILSSLGVKLSHKSSGDSWLLTGVIGETPARLLGLIIWSLAFVGFITGGMGFAGWLIPGSWWPTLTGIAAVLSLFGLIFFWNGFAFIFNKISAIIVNVAVLISVLGNGWMKPYQGN